VLNVREVNGTLRSRGGLAVIVMGAVIAFAISAVPVLQGNQGNDVAGRTPVAQNNRVQEKQYADEIIRRLRRLGLYFNPGRISRPYDPDGELA
jgi:hypothetical protein